MFGSENDLVRNAVLWQLSKELAMQQAAKNEHKPKEAKPPWPAHRRFWHRLWPAPKPPKQPAAADAAAAAPERAAAAA